MDSKGKNELKEIISDPLDDTEIKHYLPEARILKYSELSIYKTIEQLLPHPKSYVIVLIEATVNNGHWITITRFENIIEYFDSYGLYPDQNLTWIPENKREILGQSVPYISNLFDKTKLKVVYNDVNYQKAGSKVATCGRYCVFRILLLKEYNLSLEGMHQVLEYFKKNKKLSYDETVSLFIDIT